MTAIIAAIVIAILPPAENKVAVAVAREYNLTAEQTALLCAIRKTENGRAGFEFGVVKPEARRHADGVRSFKLQAQWCAGTIRKRYTGDIRAFAKRWCPNNWRTWEKNTRWFMRRQGFQK